MSVRIMMWNIKFFTDQNFSTASRTDSLSAQHLVDAVKVVNPDILVVIEVRSGNTGGVGRLLSDTGGAAGVLVLQETLGNNWYVVPPQVLNEAQADLQVTESRYFEGIAVYFRSTQLDFIGPWLWTGKEPQSRASVDPTDVEAYDGAWANALPTSQPANCKFGTKTQNQFAGQPFFRDDDDMLIEFPALWARNPWYTAFWDKTASRVIKLVAVHLPPQWTMSRKAMVELGKVDISPKIAPADTKGVQVICGDFNVNMLNPNQNSYFQEGFLNGYTALLASNASQATLIRKAVAQTKAPYLRAPTNWWKKDKDGYYSALDNILVKYYGGGGPAAAFGVLDWVRIPKPGTSSTNANAYMATPLNQIATDDQFVNKFNFGKFRGTSDHLGLYADV